MSKKSKLIAELRAKTGMAHADAKRVVESRVQRTDDPAPQVSAKETTIAGVISKTIELAQARHDEAEERIRVRGSALFLAADLVEERRLRGWKREPADQALRDFLLAQPLPVLQKIQAVMYAGRGDDDVLDLFDYLSGDDDDHFATAAQIASKSPLAEYLRAGLTETIRAKVDLEADWDDLLARRGRSS